jgi:hypothetical protein
MINLMASFIVPCLLAVAGVIAAFSFGNEIRFYHLLLLSSRLLLGHQVIAYA